MTTGKVIYEENSFVRLGTETGGDKVIKVTVSYDYIQTAINELFLNNNPTGTILTITDQNAINAVQEQINTVTSSEKESFQEQLNNAQQQLDARIAQEQAYHTSYQPAFLRGQPSKLD